MRYKPVHDNEYMKTYALIEEMGKPLAFHAAYNWQNQYMEQMNRFISVHALGFPYLQHPAHDQLVINGIFERFPKLKTMWIEGGVAWVPFLMQRLDNEYMMRPSECPLLKQLPSEYMADSIYATQPMELTEDIGSSWKRRSTRSRPRRSCCFSTDYPHWDFDLPSTIYDLPFLSEQHKRNILGGNAQKLFGMETPKKKLAVMDGVSPAGTFPAHAGGGISQPLSAAKGRGPVYWGSFARDHAPKPREESVTYRKPGLAVALFASFALCADAAQAQTYPERPVKIIVPFAAGGPTDVMARLLAQQFSENLGKQFVVENQPGAGGNTGMGNAARATPDGYTILVSSSSYVVNPSLSAKLSYDPYKDFIPISNVGVSPNTLVVHPSVPAKSVSELISYIKGSPGKVSYASPGAGTTPHLSGELFRLTLSLDLVHVPFSGAGPAIQSTVGGHTPIAFVAMPPATALVKEGKLRGLAVTSKQRAPALPDVPTMVEAGIKDQEADTFQGLFVPAGTPQAIVDTLQREVVKILARPETRAKFAELGFETIGSSPEQFAAQIRTEIARWGKVIKDAGIKAEEIFPSCERSVSSVNGIAAQAGNNRFIQWAVTEAPKIASAVAGQLAGCDAVNSTRSTNAVNGAAIDAASMAPAPITAARLRIWPQSAPCRGQHHTEHRAGR